VPIEEEEEEEEINVRNKHSVYQSDESLVTERNVRFCLIETGGQCSTVRPNHAVSLTPHDVVSN
jgi:hypothetical protein